MKRPVESAPLPPFAGCDSQAETTSIARVEFVVASGCKRSRHTTVDRDQQGIRQNPHGVIAGLAQKIDRQAKPSTRIQTGKHLVQSSC
jgi:hypothetical protein